MRVELLDPRAGDGHVPPPLPCTPAPDDPATLVVDSPWFRGHVRRGADPLTPPWSASMQPLDPEVPPTGLERRVFAMLRMLTCMNVTARGGVALHGATVERDGRAIVFVGRRRAGKTTLVRRLPEGMRSLGDDLALLLPTGDGFVAHGSPFTGRERTAAELGAAPLHRVCVIEQGERTIATPLGARDATRELLRRAFLHVDAPSERQRVVDATLRLVARVPVLRVTIHLETSPWTLEALS